MRWNRSWPRTGEGEIAEFLEDDEVHAREIVGHAALAAGAGLRLEFVDEIDHVEEAATSTGPVTGAGDGDGQMGLAGSGAADQHGVALMARKLPEARSRTQGLGV